MRALVLVLVLAAAVPLHAQQQRDRGGAKGFLKPAPERRTAEAPHPDPRRPERMSPADRERLRRDIEDANRRMEPPRRR